MGAARLGFVATFLSDPLIRGFTTGSAVFVVVSQLKHILGLKVPQITGPLASAKVWYEREGVGARFSSFARTLVSPQSLLVPNPRPVLLSRNRLKAVYFQFNNEYQ